MRRRYEDDDEDGDETVRDRDTVRVPLLLCDSVSPEFAFDLETRRRFGGAVDVSDHQPGYRFSGDREVLDARAKARAARDAYIERTVNAWRRPVRDFAEPDQGTRPEELMRRQRRGESDPERADEVERQRERWLGGPGEIDKLARDLEAKRRANHAEYAANLSNAWKTNKGTAAPATLGQEKGRAWRLSPPG